MKNMKKYYYYQISKILNKSSHDDFFRAFLVEVNEVYSTLDHIRELMTSGQCKE